MPCPYNSRLLTLQARFISRPFVSLTQGTKLAKDTYLAPFFSPCFFVFSATSAVKTLNSRAIVAFLLASWLPQSYAFESRICFLLRNTRGVSLCLLLSLAFFAALREAKLVSFSVGYLNLSVQEPNPTARHLICLCLAFSPIMNSNRRTAQSHLIIAQLSLRRRVK